MCTRMMDFRPWILPRIELISSVCLCRKDMADVFTNMLAISFCFVVLVLQVLRFGFICDCFGVFIP